jgi:hypothetical protein
MLNQMSSGGTLASIAGPMGEGDVAGVMSAAIGQRDHMV